MLLFFKNMFVMEGELCLNYKDFLTKSKKIKTCK